MTHPVGSQVPIPFTARDSTGAPFTAMMTSPGVIPALSAGDLPKTRVTSAPRIGERARQVYAVRDRICRQLHLGAPLR